MRRFKEWSENIEKCRKAMERVYNLDSQNKIMVSAVLKYSCDIVDAYVEDIPEDIYEMFYEEAEGIIRDLIGDKEEAVEMIAESFDMGIVDAFYYYCRPEKMDSLMRDF